jgi:predicted nucleic acid-binding protein
LIGQPKCLVDTNILLRLANPDTEGHYICEAAIRRLQDRGVQLYFTLQNAAEFWNVSTRPITRNGQGLTPEAANRGLNLFEQEMSLLPDNLQVFVEWRRLVFQHQVRGIQVHDAKLAASMIVHGVRQILTFNTADFARFTEVEAVHPASLL